MAPNMPKIMPARYLSFVNMSAGLSDVIWLVDAIEMCGSTPPAKSVKWRHAHRTPGVATALVSFARSVTGSMSIGTQAEPSVPPSNPCFVAFQ